MREIQEAILNYVKDNKYGSLISKYAGIMAIVWPIYVVLSNITLLNPLWNIIGMISAVFYIAHYIGIIVCFAENKMQLLSVAFGCLMLNQIWILKYGINLNRIIYIVFYGFIAVICWKATNGSSVQNGVNEKTLFCPVCGTRCGKDMKFCSKCGNPIEK